MSEKLAETRGKKQRVLVVSKLKRRHKLPALFRQLSFVKTFFPLCLFTTYRRRSRRGPATPAAAPLPRYYIHLQPSLNYREGNLCTIYART